MMNGFYSPNECIDHPLGILCRCEEYREIAKKFVVNTVGTGIPKIARNLDQNESDAPEKIVWTLQKAEINANPTKPVLHFPVIDDKIEKITEKNVEKIWIPADTNLVSAKELRPNLSYLHKTAQNTQSAEISVLTDMLPHRGRVKKRKDIDWGIGSHTTPVTMTDEPETNFYPVKSCFTTWAEAYTRATDRPAY